MFYITDCFEDPVFMLDDKDQKVQDVLKLCFTQYPEIKSFRCLNISEESAIVSKLIEALRAANVNIDYSLETK